MASATGTTGRASNVKAGNIEQNLCTSSGSSHSINIYPPQSPTRMTKDSILKLAGAFHGLKTSRIRFCAFSYSIGGFDERMSVRRRLGLPTEGRLVVSVSRLVPRKGMDVLIEAVGQLSAERPDLTLAIGGSGRDRRRLELAARRCSAPVRFLGRVADDDLPMLDAAADVWAMCCRDRWFGLEQEGFGIVFLEAAAAGVAQLAGRSGGSDEAVVDGKTGLVVDRPGDATAVAAALARLLDDSELRERLGAEARRRAVAEFDYDKLARMLHQTLVEMGS